MIYTTFKDKKISKLGFGIMRMPMKDGEIDMEESARMMDYCIANGVNYFDTAHPYHAGKSEGVLAKLLERYPRDRYFIADKYPGHQLQKVHKPAEIFEEQLRRCHTDYFDFYLLHNVCENSFDAYTKNGVVEYFIKEREAGRIKHFGFSSHASPETLEKFIDFYDGVFEFCQIQLNYLDWSLQDAARKVDILREKGLPIWVMEPVHGGKLAKLADDEEAVLRSMRPDESTAAWAFRWLQGKDVDITLSGMSTFDQVVDNIRTYEELKPLSPDEEKTLFGMAERLKDSVPCTGCRYCTDGCPAGLDIPLLISHYNDMKVQPSFTVSMFMDTLGKARPESCIGCGKCAAICPQGIDIPGIMKDFSERLEKFGTWEAVAAQRERDTEERRAEEARNALQHIQG